MITSYLLVKLLGTVRPGIVRIIVIFILPMYGKTEKNSMIDDATLKQRVFFSVTVTFTSSTKWRIFLWGNHACRQHTTIFLYVISLTLMFRILLDSSIIKRFLSCYSRVTSTCPLPIWYICCGCKFSFYMSRS